jgi:hypothetical protein
MRCRIPDLFISRDLWAVVAALLVAAAMPVVASEGKPLAICPVLEAELEKAFGVSYKLVPTGVSKREDVEHHTCRAQGSDASYLFINQIRFPESANLKRLDAALRVEMQDATRIPGDPDQARWLSQPQFSTHKLGYIRGKVITMLTFNGVPVKRIDSLRDSALKLRRVP